MFFLFVKKAKILISKQILIKRSANCRQKLSVPNIFSYFRLYAMHHKYCNTNKVVSNLLKHFTKKYVKKVTNEIQYTEPYTNVNYALMLNYCNKMLL